MSDVEYRTFTGFVVIPSAANGKPYTRKAGEKTISTYLFSVPALNGTDQLINLDFWEGTPIPECVKDKAALLVTGKYDPQTWDDKKTGEERRKIVITPNRMVPLGDNVMEPSAPNKPTVKKRSPAVNAELSDDFDF